MTSTATNVAAAANPSVIIDINNNTNNNRPRTTSTNENNPYDESITDRTINMAMCCLTPSAILTVLGLIVGYVVWLVYSIIALTEVSDSTVRTNCGSLLWRYVLTVCIMIVTSFKLVNSSKDSTDKGDHALGICCVLSLTFIVFSGLASWGSYELWGRDCSDDLRDYKIYTMGYIAVVYQWSIAGICFLMLCGLCFRAMLCR